MDTRFLSSQLELYDQSKKPQKKAPKKTKKKKENPAYLAQSGLDFHA